MLSIRQTLSHHRCLLLLLLLLLVHLQLSQKQSLAAVIPLPGGINPPPAGDILLLRLLHTTTPREDSEVDAPLPQLMLAADVDTVEKKKKTSPGAINWYPSTNGNVGVEEGGHYNPPDIIVSSLLELSERRGGGEEEEEDVDNKVDGTQTGESQGAERGDYLELLLLSSVNYEDAVKWRGEGDNLEDLEGEEQVPVIANKWKRHLITAPTFDNCPSGTRWVRNECRDVVYLEPDTLHT